MAQSESQPDSADALYIYYQNKPGLEVSLERYFTEEHRLNLFFNDRKDSAFFAPFLDSLRLQYPSEWKYVDNLVRYVQENIDYEKYNPGEYIKYPWQTFMDHSGVCSDKSVLLGKLLVYSGYKVAMFAFFDAEHMGVGLKVPQKHGSFNSPYIYIETTNVRPMGSIPYDSFKQGDLDNPAIFEIEENGERVFTSLHTLQDYYDSLETSYGEDFLFLDRKSRFLNMRINDMQSVVDSLKNNLDYLTFEYEALTAAITEQNSVIAEMGCNGVINDDRLFEECEKKMNQYNKQVEIVNSISENLKKESVIRNQLVKELNKFIDEYNAHINAMNNQ